MIPRVALDAWAQQVPWPDPLDVEQDLILSRAIVDIAGHPRLGSELAFRGGTSIHKLHLPRPWRYSNDLDYVRTTTGSAKPLMAAIRDVLTGAGLDEARYEQKSDTITMRFATEPTAQLGQIRVKVEVNVREVVPCFGHHTVPFAVDNPWFRDHADVLTFELDELLGTKLRALHQRRKGRDLFDLWLGLTHFGSDPDRIVDAFRHYLAQSGVRIAPADFAATLDAKLGHRGFVTDLDSLVATRPPDYTPEAAADLVRDVLIPRL